MPPHTDSSAPRSHLNPMNQPLEIPYAPRLAPTKAMVLVDAPSKAIAASGRFRHSDPRLGPPVARILHASTHG